MRSHSLASGTPSPCWRAGERRAVISIGLLLPRAWSVRMFKNLPFATDACFISDCLLFLLIMQMHRYLFGHLSTKHIILENFLTKLTEFCRKFALDRYNYTINFCLCSPRKSFLPAKTTTFSQRCAIIKFARVLHAHLWHG